MTHQVTKFILKPVHVIQFFIGLNFYRCSRTIITEQTQILHWMIKFLNMFLLWMKNLCVELFEIQIFHFLFYVFKFIFMAVVSVVEWQWNLQAYLSHTFILVFLPHFLSWMFHKHSRLLFKYEKLDFLY